MLETPEVISRRVRDETLSQPLSSAKVRLLVDSIQQLSLARGVDRIVEIVRHAARQLTGADGATFVLRDGPFCFYVDEDAISPLWKGQRFPLETCISGWAMLNGQSTVVPDIYLDSRIPHAAYRPTFVRSLAMVPIRATSPIGAIGNYWAQEHTCTADELMLLETLANSTAVAFENVNMYADLERQVRRRTRELEMANQELEAFTAAVSHDLRAPLRAINAEVALKADAAGALAAPSVTKVQECVSRMSDLIEDLLRLSKFTRAELKRSSVDLAALATRILDQLRTNDPSRSVRCFVQPCEPTQADEGLMTVALENLLSNAWKYSSKRAVSEIEFVSSSDEHGHTVYTVRDNGAGFDPKYAARLFEPFGRLHDASEFSGTGIGLATVQRIIERHGGRIWARSDGANGAEFLLRSSKTRA